MYSSWNIVCHRIRWSESFSKPDYGLLLTPFPFHLQAILNDISERKPFLDRLGKVGPNLARLCKGSDGGNVMAKVESVAERYNDLRSAVQDQSAKLQEKDEQTQKVGRVNTRQAVNVQ